VIDQIIVQPGLDRFVSAVDVSVPGRGLDCEGCRGRERYGGEGESGMAVASCGVEEVAKVFSV